MNHDLLMLQNLAVIGDSLLDKLQGCMVQIKPGHCSTVGMHLPDDITIHEDDQFQIVKARLRTFNNTTHIRITIDIMGWHVLVEHDVLLFE